MATYGKRRRPFISHLADLQDDEAGAEDGRRASGKSMRHTRLLSRFNGLASPSSSPASSATSMGNNTSRVDAARAPPKRTGSKNVEVISHPRSNLSQDARRSPGSANDGITTNVSISKEGHRHTDMPITLPPKANSKGRPPTPHAKPALTAKSTNISVTKQQASGLFRRGKDSAEKSLTAFKSSKSPVQQSQTAPIVSSPRLPGGLQPIVQNDGGSIDISTTQGAADLSRKIESLIAQSEQDQSSPDDGGTSVATQSQFHLQKGKAVFGRVKDALSDRFPGNTDKRPDVERRNSRFSSVGNGSPLSRGDEVGGAIGRVRSHTTENQSVSTQVRETHQIPRKPLPANIKPNPESALRLESEPPLQGQDAERAKFVENANAFDFGFPPHPGSQKGESNTGKASSQRPTPHPSRVKTTSEAIPAPLRSPAILDFFSSSPVDFSTPRIRLEPSYSADGKKTLTSVLANEQSLLGHFDFEAKHRPPYEDPPCDPTVTKKRSSTSLKRKPAGGKEVRLGAVVRPVKKVKKGGKRIPSDEDDLSAGVGKLSSSRSPRTADVRPHGLFRGNSKGRGLNIFDRGNSSSNKSTESLKGSTDSPKKPRGRSKGEVAGAKHESNTREAKGKGKMKATSVPGRRHSGHARGGAVEAEYASDTDVDELALDLTPYQVRGLRR
ncbi:MAG: hypothetical protein M1833_006118 [Piccolia ochrophora]|nr:MAG: hypothetical protein M1833_006118 [Piccolia ochrophora]